MKYVLSLLAIVILLLPAVHAQHEHMNMSDTTKPMMNMKMTSKKPVANKKISPTKKAAPAKKNIQKKTIVKPVQGMNVNDTSKHQVKMDMNDTMQMNMTDTSMKKMNMNEIDMKRMDMNKGDTTKPTMKMNMADSSMKEMNMNNTATPGMNMSDHEMMDMGSQAFSKNLPMSRDGSGTSWMPDETPVYAYMIMKEKTMIMLHGNIFLRYANHDIFNKGSRGGSGFEAPNWFMGMIQKEAGQKGLFMARAMISLDPLTVGGNGYPLLFQSGETYKGERLIDHQHPHDLFSELSIGYSYALSRDADIVGYVGYPGEPALGPPAFMHRTSAMSDPDAPLSHHWQDATHITFGVGTFGFRYKNFKIEGSAFNGREPNENRYNLDKITINSYSYRISVNPSAQWALQFSQGFIQSPEASEPGVDVTRTTASALFSKKKNNDGNYDAAIVWGYNNKNDGHKEHSLLLEDNHRFKKNTVYSRYEFVQKSSEELDLLSAFGDVEFNIHAFTMGYNHLIFAARFFDFLGGFQGTINFSPKKLQNLYGKNPLALEVYLQIRPKLHYHQ
jgi:hypothetical protein